MSKENYIVGTIGIGIGIALLAFIVTMIVGSIGNHFGFWGLFLIFVIDFTVRLGIKIFKSEG